MSVPLQGPLLYRCYNFITPCYVMSVLLQEPLLYRCSLEVRCLQQFSGLHSPVADVTRWDVLCPQLEFSITGEDAQFEILAYSSAHRW